MNTTNNRNSLWLLHDIEKISISRDVFREYCRIIRLIEPLLRRRNLRNSRLDFERQEKPLKLRKLGDSLNSRDMRMNNGVLEKRKRDKKNWNEKRRRRRKKRLVLRKKQLGRKLKRNNAFDWKKESMCLMLI